MRLLLALITLLAAAVPAFAQSGAKDISHSAAYLRDVCTGHRTGLSRTDQEKMCGLYLLARLVCAAAWFLVRHRQRAMAEGDEIPSRGRRLNR
jgi:hypothetical protein